MRPFLVVMLVAVSVSAQTPSLSGDLKGKLVTVKNKLVQPIDAAPVTKAKYIAFYFGAGWCGPCHKFTPDLVSFYNEMKPKYRADFEVVSMSEDKDAGEMQKYMNEMSMPWPAVRWDAVKWAQARNRAFPLWSWSISREKSFRIVTTEEITSDRTRCWTICASS